MKTIALILFMALSTSIVKAEQLTEAERMAKYQAMVDSQYNTAATKLQAERSPLDGVPLGVGLSAGALAYSLHDMNTSNPYAVGSALGAASSLLPHVTDRTASSILRSIGWR